MDAFLAHAASLRAFEIAAKNALLERKRELDEGLLRVDWLAGECRVSPLAFVCHCYVLFYLGWVGRCAGMRDAGGDVYPPPPWGGGERPTATAGARWGRLCFG